MTKLSFNNCYYFVKSVKRLYHQLHSLLYMSEVCQAPVSPASLIALQVWSLSNVCFTSFTHCSTGLKSVKHLFHQLHSLLYRSEVCQTPVSPASLIALQVWSLSSACFTSFTHCSTGVKSVKRMFHQLHSLLYRSEVCQTPVSPASLIALQVWCLSNACFTSFTHCSTGLKSVKRLFHQLHSLLYRCEVCQTSVSPASLIALQVWSLSSTCFTSFTHCSTGLKSVKCLFHQLHSLLYRCEVCQTHVSPDSLIALQVWSLSNACFTSFTHCSTGLMSVKRLFHQLHTLLYRSEVCQTPVSPASLIALQVWSLSNACFTSFTHCSEICQVTVFSPSLIVLQVLHTCNIKLNEQWRNGNEEMCISIDVCMLGYEFFIDNICRYTILEIVKNVW